MSDHDIEVLTALGATAEVMSLTSEARSRIVFSLSKCVPGLVVIEQRRARREKTVCGQPARNRGDHPCLLVRNHVGACE